jgi:hypothetical protein
VPVGVCVSAFVTDVDRVLSFGLDVELRRQERIACRRRGVVFEDALGAGFGFDGVAKVVDRVNFVGGQFGRHVGEGLTRTPACLACRRRE